MLNMSFRLCALITSLIVTVVSCSSKKSASKDEPSTKTPVKQTVSKDLPKRQGLTSSLENMKKMAAGINTMGDKILQALLTKTMSGKSPEALARAGKNPIISPYSIASAFSLAWLGAKGTTEKEFVSLFSSTLPFPSQHEALGSLQQDLEKVTNLKLSVANSLWLESSMPVKRTYLENTSRWYGAAPFMVDFIKGYKEVTIKINKWVAEKTNNRIKNLIPKGALNNTNRAVLVNAIWFLAKWQHPFKKTSTFMLPFYPAPGFEVVVPTMIQKAQFPMAKGSDGEMVISLPYKGDRFAFYAYLPKNDGPLAMPAGETLEKLVSAVKPGEVLLFMPKFTLETNDALGTIIKNMGMPITFAPGADFGGIATTPGGLYISEVFHNTYVRVDEEGTEAAAATALVMKAGGKPAPVPQVRLNRPFYFFIRDKKTGLNLFAGWVINPYPKAPLGKSVAKK